MCREVPFVAACREVSCTPGGVPLSLEPEFMRIVISCPHCGARPKARTSREMSRTLRELTYMCQNPACGHTYVANLEIVRTLSPSAIPHPDVRLPFSPHVRERIMKQLEFAL